MRRAVRNRPRRPWACLRLARTALAAHWSEPVLLPRSYSIDANKHPSSKSFPGSSDIGDAAIIAAVRRVSASNGRDPHDYFGAFERMHSFSSHRKTLIFTIRHIPRLEELESMFLGR